MQRILILIVVNLIVYFRAFSAKWEYVVDDQLVPKKKGKNFLHTFFLQWHAMGYSNIQIERLQRILIHAAVCVLIYIAFGKSDISFVAALLFAVNPANNQGTLWLNGVGYSMSTVCALAMVAWPAYGAIPYFYSMFWHVTAMPAPLLFLLRGPKYAIAYIVIFFVLGWLVEWRIPLFKVQDNATMKERFKVPNRAMGTICPRKMVFVIKSYGYFFLTGLLPRRLGLYHTFGYSYGLSKKDIDQWESFSPLFWLSAAISIAVVYAIVHFWGTLLSFGLFWHLMFIAPWCNLIIMQQPMSDRQMFLPNAGLMFAASWVFFKTPYPYILATALGTFYLTKLWYFMPAYKSQADLVEMSIRDHPDQFALWNWKGILAREKNHLFTKEKKFL